LLLEVHACGVCRTDLHLRDAEIAATKLPIVLGHQIVATTTDGRRVGVPWLGWTDGTCRYCTSGRENLCVDARFTGRDIDGGYAELTVADERFCFSLPDELSDQEAAPLLCGGLIGYRALTFTGDAERLGLYGFGSAAHMICQLAAFQGRQVFAFTRPGMSTRRRSRAASAHHGREGAMRHRPSRSTRRSSSRLPARSSPRRSRCSRRTEWSSAPGFT
jgi:propanol-preferring alcohol dehydrogenase